MLKAIFIALILLFASSLFTKTFAQTISTSSAIPKVEYALPYPGLLPDNPLYYLKALRDNLTKLLIRDPMKKAEFNLLQSDKRLEAARLLIEKNENELSLTTLGKSGNYFDDAVINIYNAKKNGEDVKELLNKLITSSVKHQEIIRNMEMGKRGDFLINIKFEEARAHDFEERLTIIKSQ